MAETEFGKLGEPIAKTQVRVRKAARGLARVNLVHAYGHVSARLDDKTLLVCAAKPMGTIEPGEDGTVVPIAGPLPNGVLGEVRIHQQIYQRRPDVNGVCRFFPKTMIALSTMRIMPKPRHGPGTYFYPEPPLWDDPMLLRDDGQAAKLAETLGNARGIVMRGNGAVCVGATVEEAIVMAFYLEDAAQVELQVRTLGQENTAPLFSAEQAKARAGSAGRIYERMWDYMTHGDPE
ncbi:MAG TPA: class II aldolase/adducin family protein [Alphaproteobacteria bacterium]